MPKKGHKVIQKDILGRLGRLFSTHAGMEKDSYDNKKDKEYIYKDSKNTVPSVPKSERIEVCRELKTPVRSVRKSPDVSIPVNRPYWQRPDGSCYGCNGREYWQSIHGVTVCARCHPPGCEKLVAHRYGTA